VGGASAGADPLELEGAASHRRRAGNARKRWSMGGLAAQCREEVLREGAMEHEIDSRTWGLHREEVTGPATADCISQRLLHRT